MKWHRSGVGFLGCLGKLRGCCGSALLGVGMIARSLVTGELAFPVYSHCLFLGRHRHAKMAMEVENQPHTLPFPLRCEHRLPGAQQNPLLTPVSLSPASEGTAFLYVRLRTGVLYNYSSTPPFICTPQTSKLSPRRADASS